MTPELSRTLMTSSAENRGRSHKGGDSMIAVTGITGRSGTHFLRRLIAEREKCSGMKFRMIVRKTSRIDVIESSDLSVEMAIGDLDDVAFVDECLRGITTVVHIAGIGKSLRLVEAGVSNRVKRMILVHTTGIYSRFKSASAGYLEIEAKILKMIEGKDVNLTILRPTMIYGSQDDSNVIQFIKMVDTLRLFPVVNGAKFGLQPVHQKDLGDAYYKVLVSADATRNKNYVLSGGQPIKLIEMLNIISSYLDKKTVFFSVPFPVAYACACVLFSLTLGTIDYREKVQRLVEPRTFSHKEASEDFGYSPVGFRDGVRNEVDEYLRLRGRHN